MPGSLSQTLALWSLLARWKQSAAEVFPLDPAATVTDFESLWRWMLPNLLLAETRQAADELRALVEVSNN